MFSKPEFNPNQDLNKYDQGLHDSSVSECTVCNEKTEDCSVQIKWEDPADVICVDAKVCSCYSQSTLSEKIIGLITLK